MDQLEFAKNMIDLMNHKIMLFEMIQQNNSKLDAFDKVSDGNGFMVYGQLTQSIKQIDDYTKEIKDFENKFLSELEESEKND